MAIYVQIDGIKGNATQEGHKDWLDISSLQWGVSRRLATPTGSSINREASEPSVSEVTLTKLLDASSPPIFQQATTGKAGGIKTTIHLVTTGDPGLTYMEYVLENSLISSYSVSSSGDRPYETIMINFTKITMKFTPYDDKNKPGSPVGAGYDLATTKNV
jgi:type VI secretion system secreted protein Hcp